MQLDNPIKAALRRGEPSFGSWLSIAHPVVAELMAESGLDWLVVDTEHGPIDLESSLNLAQAMKGTRCIPFVRLAANDPIWIRRCLDAGYRGLIVPMVNTAEAAAAAVRAAKYPPAGTRGIGLARAQGYGRQFEEYLARANDEIVVMPQIEHVQAVENVERILAVEGVDAVFVGPLDLSGSMGLLGQTDHPRMVAAIDTVLAACQRAGKPAGLYIGYPDLEQVRRRLAQGFTFLALSLDILMLARGCAELVAMANALRPKAPQADAHAAG